jgi:cap1 methyltransferase
MHDRLGPVQGYGITLKQGEMDISLTSFLPSINRALYTPMYGHDGTGDILNPDNMRHFISAMASCAQDGVDLVVADGGVESVVDQESAIASLGLSQTIIALSVLCPHGNFVMKLFDVVSTFTVDILMILTRCFDKVTLVKPVASRPANSERYLYSLGVDDGRYVVCMGFRACSPSLLSHLFTALASPCVARLLRVVDDAVVDVVKSVNMVMAIRQKEALELIIQCLAQTDDGDVDGVKETQEDIRNYWCEQWKIPKRGLLIKR